MSMSLYSSNIYIYILEEAHVVQIPFSLAGLNIHNNKKVDLLYKTTQSPYCALICDPFERFEAWNI